MKFYPVVIAILASCLTSDPPPDEPPASIALAPGCDEWGCGMNSPVVDGIHGFHDLNSDGQWNDVGYRMGNVHHAPYASNYTLSVVNGEFVLTRVGSSGDPATITGLAVKNTDVDILLGSSTTAAYIMHIGAASSDVNYWANAPLRAHVTQYAITYTDTFTGQTGNICAHPPAKIEDVTNMLPERTIVFEGERIHSGGKWIETTLDKSWFNLGCAQSTLAKLYLTGHVEAASVAGFSTTIPQRQTMLKMLSGDYCGTGEPFTVAGQPLTWADDAGTMTLALPAIAEAMWTPAGASCLNTPRVVAHPTWLSHHAFPVGVETAIANTCTRPPTCPTRPPNPQPHLMSANPAPFTP